MLLSSALRSIPANKAYAATNTDSLSINRSLSSSNFTFSSVNIGEENAARTLVICVWTSTNGSSTSYAGIPTLTVNGVAATRVIERTVGTFCYASAFLINVDVGTTASIVVTPGGNTTYCNIGVWSIVRNSMSLTPLNKPTTAIAFGVSGNLSLTVNTRPQGVVIAFASSLTFSGSPGAITWTNASVNFNKNYAGTSSSWFSGAIIFPIPETAVPSVIITATRTSNQQSVLMALSF